MAGAPAPGPGLLAEAPDGTSVGWARLTPRAELRWLRARFGERLPDGDDVSTMPCLFVRTRWRNRGVMSARPFLRAGFAEVSRLSEDRPVVRYRP